MSPKHSKDPATLKYFEYLMGERYDSIMYIQISHSYVQLWHNYYTHAQ